MERLAYPSDISREEFERVRPLLEGGRRRTRPRKHDLYDIFCAVLYLLDTGSPWRAIPPGFPPWRTVHEYFTHWTMESVDGQLLLESVLIAAGRDTALAQLRLQLRQRRWPFYAAGSNTRR